jgi:hypothetical protein
MSAKLDRDFFAADLAMVEHMLGAMTDTDVFAKRSLQSRRDELQGKLASLANAREVSASASLFFGGDPVLANQGIEVSFGAQAMERFQDVVTNIFAVQHIGSLGQRGAVPGKDAAKLHITNIVRGSFGFRLEEMASQPAMIESPLKDAVDEATRLMERFGIADEEAFESEVENLDGRVLAKIRDFFGLLNENRATFRLVSGDRDRSFRSPSIARAAERAKNTSLDEQELEFPGQLLGALCVSRTFDFHSENQRGIIKGSISVDLSEEDILRINRELSGQNSLARIRVKSVRQNDRVLREKFTLLAIRAR